MSRCLALVASVLVLAASVSAWDSYFPPHNDVARCADPTIQNTTLYYDLLEASTQMPAQVIALRVGVPFATLVKFFDMPQYWPVWNHLFGTNGVTSYNLCDPFNNVTYTNPPPVVPAFPSDLQAPHWIDQHGYNAQKNVFAFGWIFQLNSVSYGGNLVFGRHTFTIKRYVDQSGNEASTVESFEKAAGPQMETAVNQYAWTKALEESLLDAANGFVCLERVYTATGALHFADVNATCAPSKWTP